MSLVPRRALVAGPWLGLVLLAACAQDRFTEDELSSSGGPYVPTAESGVDACQDGIDNDGDGYIDCVDLDCQPGEEPNPACLPDGMPEDTIDRCQDGIDNDENGFPDCQDFSCQDFDICPQEDTDELCSDMEDNDGNGFVDCEDFGCSMNPDVTVCD